MMASCGDVHLVVYPLKLTEMYHVMLVNTCCQSMEFSVSYVQADRPTGTSVQLWIGLENSFSRMFHSLTYFSRAC